MEDSLAIPVGDWYMLSEETVPSMDAPNKQQEQPPFPCPIAGCTRDYIFKSDLKYHVLKKHADYEAAARISPARSTKVNKPYPCPDPACPCGYMHLRELKNHLRQKHTLEQ